MKKITVIDIASTDQGAYRLLKNRVKLIDKDLFFENFLVCPEGQWQRKMVNEGIKWIKYNVNRTLGIKATWQEIKSLEKLLVEINPDIVHSHNSKTGVLARIAVKLVNRKHNKNIVMIHQVHGYHFTSLRGIKRYVFLIIEKKLAKITDILLFQNKYELNLSEKYAMNKWCDLIYIGNGINIREFQEERVVSKAQDETRIICIARIEPVKNHMMLLKSLRCLKDKYNINNFKAILIGEGNIEELTTFINENSLANNVIFTGVLDRKEVINQIYNSDISVLTSIKEGRPRALMESMVLGKPCVATDVVGTNEVVINNSTGYLVKLNDYEDFALKLKELIENKALYKTMSENCKNYACEEFNEEKVVKKLKDIYLKALGL